MPCTACFPCLCVWNSVSGVGCVRIGFCKRFSNADSSKQLVVLRQNLARGKCLEPSQCLKESTGSWTHMLLHPGDLQLWKRRVVHFMAPQNFSFFLEQVRLFLVVKAGKHFWATFGFSSLFFSCTSSLWLKHEQTKYGIVESVRFFFSFSSFFS